MPKIEIQIEIKADIEFVFDFARSIDLHKILTHQTNERAIAGKISGLIDLNESVTWRAKHFGVYQNVTSKITKLDRPFFFVDEMQEAVFKFFKHEHLFSYSEGITLMTDNFE